mgnify:CR=1 FL=1
MNNLDIINLVKDLLSSMPERTPQELEKLKNNKENFLNDVSDLVLAYSIGKKPKTNML